VRIVQLANFYGPTSGGLRTTVDALGAGYTSAGVDRVVIVPGAEATDGPTVAGRRITVPARRLPGGSGYRAITDLARVRAVVEELNPDRLEVSDKLTLHRLARWAAARGVPSVLLSHERLDSILAPHVPRGLPLRRAADQWNRHLAAAFDVVVCASEFAAAEFDRIGARNVTRVPLGVDLSLFHPDARGARPVRWGDELRLVCVGRLSREKRPEVALDTLRLLLRSGLPASLSMIGDGPLRPRLEAIARAEHLPVTFTGHVLEPVGVAVWLAQSDLALLPGSCETFGLAALEALACGTPVVVADTGAAPELLDRAPIGIATASRPDAFAAAVRALAREPIAARRAAARRRAEDYPWSRTVAAMLALHTRLGAEPAARAS
jgi:alpha-1,6-mannosyltransferase